MLNCYLKEVQNFNKKINQNYLLLLRSYSTKSYCGKLTVELIQLVASFEQKLNFVLTATESHIVKLLNAGNKKAIELIYDQYAGTLYGVVFNMLKEEEAAKEVLQESMIKVWKNSGKYEAGKAKLFTWLMRITRNTAIDYMRSQKTRTEHEIQKASSDVSRNVVYIRPEHMDVAKHLNSLEHKYKEVLYALFYKGMTQQEVSDHFNIPLGTVKTRLKIGLRELRKIFNDPLVLVSLIILMMT
ncbi:MAG: sigma-70 family RNA polymerase sigma factor [Bacteroidota bacterium]